MYMSQQDLDFKEELEKSIDLMYSKHVPANVRNPIYTQTARVTTVALVFLRQKTASNLMVLRQPLSKSIY